MSDEPKYPNVKVKLVGEDGNAFFILGRVRNEMKKNNVPAEDINKFMAEAMSGDYNNLLQTCMKYVSVR
jgi:oligoribonuclease NrnB/cAMP/cGMP phosphodiesterase (DHH superfamily)